MKLFITLLISGIFTNNIITNSLLGVDELEKSKTKTTLELIKDCGVLTALLLVCTAVTYPILKWVLAPLKAEYLSALVCVIIICGIIFGLFEFTRRFLPEIYKIVKQNSNMLVCSPIVLGLCLMNVGNELISSYPLALLYAVVSGIGFTAVSFVFMFISQRIYETNLPQSVKGLPITLIIAALISLAFGGFSGI